MNKMKQEKEKPPKNQNPLKWGNARLVLSPKVLHAQHSGTVSLFRSLL